MERIRCVGAVVVDAAGRLLMVQRGRPPGLGLWSIPGGRVEPGESDPVAVRREVREETGIAIEVGTYLGSVERDAGIPGRSAVYEIHDFAARAVRASAEPEAGDDAQQARWVSPGELTGLPLVPGLMAALASWGYLAAADG